MIRNVALVGHSHSGKTALAEWMMFDNNIITKRPRSGESVLDFDPAESARHSSVFSRESYYQVICNAYQVIYTQPHQNFLTIYMLYLT